MATKREIDEATNTETTGHEWDGIKELDTPMPRWWLWTFYATIVWGVIYTILFPAWPLVTSATAGILGYSSRGAFEKDLAAHNEGNSALDGRLMQIALTDITQEEELLRYATAGGRAVFLSHCSQCHGAGGGGRPGGYPNLLDDAWLWGGSIDEIHQTIRHGIRWDDDPDTRFSQMPAYGEILSEEEIDGLVQYVIGLSGREHDTELAASAAQNFADNCAACHGEEGMGIVELGAPNLTDSIWLYGGDEASLHETIYNARYGVMPSFSLDGRLSDEDIAKVAVYVHSLGGGQ